LFAAVFFHVVKKMEKRAAVKKILTKTENKLLKLQNMEEKYQFLQEAALRLLIQLK